ncbi:MAG: T9SS type A sorting domain-containing protein [Chitinophagaceae bacterium]|nr:MAG: T9SS type A sorting domain-containing protein [Chitinophagaceae bacterium]
MRKHLVLNIFFLVLVLGVNTRALAQKGFYVPKGGKIFFAGDTSTIFSNVINKGNLGIAKPATVNMKAQSWENDPAAKITDAGAAGTGTTGEGGWVRFVGDSGRQEIRGGYNAATRTGATFPKVQVKNKDGVELKDGSAKIRNNVDFQDGHVYLNDQTLVIGNNNPGTITGYDSSKYFVTGNKPGEGLLLREQMTRKDGIVVFPVGSKDGAYTPAGIRARMRQTSDYYVGVFDSVRASEFSNTKLVSQSVNKTWQIGKYGSASLEESDIFLEHLVSEEGEYFRQNRDQSYVTQYSNQHWDMGYPQRTPAIGSMTTGNTDPSRGLNSRNFDNLGATDHYYTKLADKNKVAKTRLWFNAYRIDSGFVKVYWKTNPEINIRTFVVERRFANQTAFSDVGIQPSKANAGYSIVDLNYDMIDPNRYKGITFYRLRMIGYDNTITYSQEVPVGPQFGMYNITLWPNPAVSWFNIGIPPVIPAKTIIVYNVLGQKLREEKVMGRTVVQMTGLIPGTYFISIFSESNQLIETKKLVVAGGI